MNHVHHAHLVRFYARAKYVPCGWRRLSLRVEKGLLSAEEAAIAATSVERWQPAEGQPSTEAEWLYAMRGSGMISR